MNTKNAISLGNLMYAKEYEKVIVEGQKMLRENPQDAGVHVSLMDAFYKLREVNPSYFNLSTEHARLAILYGHDTGYAHERLMKNLMASKKYNRAMQLCSLIMRPDFSFDRHGCGDTAYFGKQSLKAMKMLDKATDTDADVLFTEKQISSIIRQTQKRIEREAEVQRIWERVERAWEAGRDAEYDRLLKQYHKLQASL